MRNRQLTERARCLLAAAILATGTFAWASTPDWLRQAAQAPLPAYSDETNAVRLFDETTVTVSPSGEVHKTCRKAYKILRPRGKDIGTVSVYFDSETQLTYLMGWSITSRNEEYEVKEKDAIETSGFSEELYSDTRYKLLHIPGAQAGNVIGYEYQQKERPSILQSIWQFQSEIPVRHARFILELPRNWTFQQHWRNHGPVNPQQTGENRWVWELSDIDAIRSEPQMPSWQSLAGHLGVSFAPDGAAKDYGSWSQIARWYWSLAASQRDPNPAIQAKTRELVAGAKDDFESIGRLAFYVQHAIRYVAIEIGIGGFQPHSAQQVFASGYGDCKDKATLLAAMLKNTGIDSYYVLINDDRDYLAADFPTALGFDHVILAIRLPEKIKQPASVAELVHPNLGRLLLFDPTDISTPLGYLPADLQTANALLVTEKDGELVKIPLLPPSVNRLLRIGTLNLDSSGTLNGTVQEIRSGPAATMLAMRLKNLPSIQRQKVFEDLLSDLIEGAVLTKASTSGLKDFSSSLGITYTFIATGYAQRAGNLFLFRPCALCRKPSNVLEGKPRKYPVAFSYTTSESDVFDVSYPSDLALDETPQPVTYQYPFATYKSESHTEKNVLHYQRTYELKNVRVDLDQLEQLKDFFRKVADDRAGYVVMRAATN